MPKPPARSASHIALQYRVNRLLAERGAEMRVAYARSVAERHVLGDYFLVDHLKRHIIIRDHVDLHDFAREVGTLRPGETPT